MSESGFDYTAMKRLIRAECGSYHNFAQQMDMSYLTLYGRFNGRSEFRASEIVRAAKILGVKTQDIGRIFLCKRVANDKRPTADVLSCPKVAKEQLPSG